MTYAVSSIERTASANAGSAVALVVRDTERPAASCAVQVMPPAPQEPHRMYSFSFVACLLALPSDPLPMPETGSATVSRSAGTPACETDEPMYSELFTTRTSRHCLPGIRSPGVQA